MSNITVDPNAKVTFEQLSEAFKTMGVSVSAATLSMWTDVGAPLDPHAKLSRKRVADALRAVGYPTSTATLATQASRGDGPPFSPWGPYTLYEWGDALRWAQGRLGKKRRSTSEGRSPEKAARDKQNAKTARDIRDAKRAAEAEAARKTSAKLSRRRKTRASAGAKPTATE